MTQDQIRRIFADNLNYYMHLRGVQQTDLAEAVGVSSGATSFWCSGEKMPRMDKIQAIAIWLGINISDLLTPRKSEPGQRSRSRQVAFDRIEHATEEQIQQLNDLLDVIWRETEQ